MVLDEQFSLTKAYRDRRVRLDEHLNEAQKERRFDVYHHYATIRKIGQHARDDELPHARVEAGSPMLPLLNTRLNSSRGGESDDMALLWSRDTNEARAEC